MKMVTVITLLTGIWAWSPFVVALDVFQTGRDISRTATRNIDSLTWSCEVGSVAGILTLEEMIERVLCHDPQLRQAWAHAKVQAALIGVKQSAYLPKLNGSSSIATGRNETVYEQREEYSSTGSLSNFESRIGLSWVLFDFGRRESALRNARHLLVAANANQDRQLQEAFILAAQLYYDALAAQGRQAAASKVSAFAAENLNAARAKYTAGIAALSDRLQAQTAYSQAKLNEVRSNGVSESFKGLIALRMGLPPQTFLELAETLRRRPEVEFIKSVDDLLDQARLDHPSIIAAKASLDADQAIFEEIQASGRPTVSFVANISDVRTSQSPQYSGNRRVRDNSFGLQLNIPLFDGFGRTYQQRGARARVEEAEAQLSVVEQRISLELWDSYQALHIESRSLETTAQWVEQSNLTLQVIQGRYKSGVGTMVELLNALSAYEAAEVQHINALRNWQIARLKLAASLGRLGFWAL